MNETHGVAVHELHFVSGGFVSPPHSLTHHHGIVQAAFSPPLLLVVSRSTRQPWQMVSVAFESRVLLCCTRLCGVVLCCVHSAAKMYLPWTTHYLH